MKKQAKVWVSILLIFSFLLPAFYHADAARVAIIKNVKGEVYIKKGNSTREFKAKEGMSLSEGDSIRTVKKSSANIVYDDGSKTSIAPSSKLSVSKLKDKANGNQTKVKVLSGKIWNSVKNLSNANDEYDVETPTAVMGVRGTHFIVTTDPLTGQSSVTVLDGTVGVSQNSEQDSDSSSGTSSGNGPTQPEQLVTFSQSLVTQSTQQPIPEAKTLDVKQLIEQVDPVIIVEIVQDLTNAIKEANEQAKQAQQLFNNTKQQDLIEKAVELSKTATTIANIQTSVLNEINQSTKKPEVEQLLQSSYQKTIENVINENNQLIADTQNTQEQAEIIAKQSGMTQEQLDKIGPVTGPASPSPEPPQPEPEPGPGPGPTPVPPKPIGTPVVITDPTKPVSFSNGVTIDLKGVSLPAGTTVTLTERTLTTQSPELNGKGLKPAGKIINFNFVGGTVTHPVEIVLPLQSGSDVSKTGIFYLKADGNWEYQPSTVENGSVKATVNHFSTYGVLEAQQALAPTVRVNEEIVAPNVAKIVDLGTSIKMEAPNTTIYYMNNFGERQVYNSSNPPVITRNEMIFRVYSSADNLRNSEIATYIFMTRPPAPNVSVDDVYNVLLGADNTMEYSTNNGASWIRYDETNPPIFEGDVTIHVRVSPSEDGEIPPSKSLLLQFSANQPRILEAYVTVEYGFITPTETSTTNDHNALPNENGISTDNSALPEGINTSTGENAPLPEENDSPTDEISTLPEDNNLSTDEDNSLPEESDSSTGENNNLPEGNDPSTGEDTSLSEESDSVDGDPDSSMIDNNISEDISATLRNIMPRLLANNSLMENTSAITEGNSSSMVDSDSSTADNVSSEDHNPTEDNADTPTGNSLSEEPIPEGNLTLPESTNTTTADTITFDSIGIQEKIAAVLLEENLFSVNLADLPSDARFTELEIVATKETEKLSVDLGNSLGTKEIYFSDADASGKRKAIISPSALGLDPQNDGISLKILKLYIQATTESDTYEIPGSLNDSVEVKLLLSFKPNHAPVINEQISDLFGSIDVIDLDVSHAFIDPDGDSLRIDAYSSNTSVATVELENNQLRISPKEAGSTTITLTATDAEGYSISQSFTVTVGMPITLDWQGYDSPINIKSGEEKQITFTSFLNPRIEQLSNIGYVFKWSKVGSVLSEHDIVMDSVVINNTGAAVPLSTSTGSANQLLKLSNEYYLLVIDSLAGNLQINSNARFANEGTYDLEIYAVQLNN
ncbi:DUF4073 domain-containing protein [Bacillus sp. Marseille-P3661]|uniref:DUF4073 domain-containing protein n=1 Tax=Bacillus sp. Marseille-P3661 TaxID=1936234 RepID=UPI000C864D73|nr:DUF4073 domain-containing protein [Bacillus sp. Marseille-P3661]